MAIKKYRALKKENRFIVSRKNLPFFLFWGSFFGDRLSLSNKKELKPGFFLLFFHCIQARMEFSRRIVWCCSFFFYWSKKSCHKMVWIDFCKTFFWNSDFCLSIVNLLFFKFQEKMFRKQKNSDDLFSGFEPERTFQCSFDNISMSFFGRVLAGSIAISDVKLVWRFCNIARIFVHWLNQLRYQIPNLKDFRKKQTASMEKCQTLKRIVKSQILIEITWWRQKKFVNHNFGDVCRSHVWQCAVWPVCFLIRNWIILVLMKPLYRINLHFNWILFEMPSILPTSHDHCLSLHCDNNSKRFQFKWTF